MGILSNNYAQIIPGALISASYVSDIYDVLMGTEPESIILSGSLTITGSVLSTTGFTGSLYGTSSWAISASRSISAVTASYAISASYINYINSSSTADSAISASYVNLAQSASYVNLAQSASYVESASYALTASYIELAQTASYITTASYALMALSASYAPSLATAVLHTHYAFIDLVTGDDATAALGDVTKPYATIASAQAALIAFGVSESQPGCIYLRSGIYTVSVTLKTNIITYCEPGVVFTSGGFIDDVNTVKAVVLGYATFKESALLYNGLFASDIHIEAFELYKMPIPSLYNERCISHNPTTSVGKAKLTVILEKCTLGNRAQDIAVRGDCDFNFTCKTPVIFYYAITLTAISAGSVNCTGTWIFTAPSWIWKTGGAFGQSFKNALYFQQTDSNFKFTINGDIINEATNTSSQLIQNNQTFGGLVTINGDIDLSIARGIHSHNNSVMTVVFNSKKIKGINGLFDTSATVFNNAGNVVKLFFNSTTFNKLVGTLTNAFKVSLNNEIGFDKCKIIQDDATIDIISVTAITAKLSMIHTDAVLVGGGGYLVNTNGNAVTIALKNCVSNMNISDVLTQKYATNNLEVEPLFTLPIY
jgi:hypothetical protein